MLNFLCHILLQLHQSQACEISSLLIACKHIIKVLITLDKESYRTPYCSLHLYFIVKHLFGIFSLIACCRRIPLIALMLQKILKVTISKQYQWAFGRSCGIINLFFCNLHGFRGKIIPYKFTARAIGHTSWTDWIIKWLFI